MRLVSRVAELRDSLQRVDVMALVPRLTLVTLLLYGGTQWYLHVPTVLVCTGAMLYRQLYQSAWFWGALAGLFTFYSFYNWFRVDNHKFLMSYWCLALALSFASSKPARVLATNARLLVVGAFGFALYWKFANIEFVSGAFFEATLLLDPRFATTSSWMTGVSLGELESNLTLMRQFLHPTWDVQSVQLFAGPGLEVVALLLTWWTLAIEALVVLGFLGSMAGWRVASLRNGALVTFAVTTYAVAAVIGFGWTLLVMGLAQTKAEESGARLAYVVAFLLVGVYRTPWAAILDSFLR